MKQMMSVLVVGATGLTGQKVVEKLLSEGYSVTILVRSIASATNVSEQLRIVQGDIFNQRLLKELIAEKDAVISCLGIGGLGDGQPNDFVSRATAGIVRAMEEAGVRRFISMSNVGAGDSKAYMGWLGNRIVIPLFLPKLIPIIQDKNVMEAHVASSSLNFTLARFPNITARPAKGNITATTTGKGLKRSITVHDAASFLVEQLTSHQFTRQYPSVSN